MMDQPAADSQSSTNATLSDRPYAEAFRSVLKDAAGVMTALPEDERDLLTSFWPATGSSYGRGHGVLVLGRAVNGWTVNSDPSRDGVDAAVDRARLEAGKGLDWVRRRRWQPRGYNTNRSQFWMTAGAMMCALDDEDPSCKMEEVERALQKDAWIQRLAWSNLYKVAPYCGGNPLGELATAQVSGARELLLKELELLQPQTVIAFTGWSDWLQPIVEQEEQGWLTDERPGDLDEIFERVGRSPDGWLWIVTRHPQGARGGRAAYLAGLRRLRKELGNWWK